MGAKLEEKQRCYKLGMAGAGPRVRIVAVSVRLYPGMRIASCWSSILWIFLNDSHSLRLFYASNDAIPYLTLTT